MLYWALVFFILAIIAGAAAEAGEGRMKKVRLRETAAAGAASAEQFAISGWRHDHTRGGRRPVTRWAIRLTTKTTRKMKNRICATLAEAAAMPPKPNTPAMMARMKNTKAQ